MIIVWFTAGEFMLVKEQTNGVEPVEHFYRRATDQTIVERIKYILLQSDISFTILMIGFILPLWSIFVIADSFTWDQFIQDPNIFIESYHNSHIKFFINNHFLMGLFIIYAAIKNLPNPLTPMLSTWMIVTWTTVIFYVDAPITDKTLGFVFISLAIIMLQRSRNYKDRRKR